LHDFEEGADDVSIEPPPFYIPPVASLPKNPTEGADDVSIEPPSFHIPPVASLPKNPTDPPTPPPRKTTQSSHTLKDPPSYSVPPSSQHTTAGTSRSYTSRSYTYFFRQLPNLKERTERAQVIHKYVSRICPLNGDGQIKHLSYCNFPFEVQPRGDNPDTQVADNELAQAKMELEEHPQKEVVERRKRNMIKALVGNFSPKTLVPPFSSINVHKMSFPSSPFLFTIHNLNERSIMQSFFLTPVKWPNTLQLTYGELLNLGILILSNLYLKAQKRLSWTWDNCNVLRASRFPKTMSTFFSGLLNLLIVLFLDGPSPESRIISYTLKQRNEAHHPFWCYLVLPLLQYAKRLLGDCVNWAFVWEEDSCFKFLARERSKVNPFGVYSHSGFKPIRQQGRAEPLEQLKGGYYPFVRLVQMISIHCNFQFHVHANNAKKSLNLSATEKHHLVKNHPLCIRVKKYDQDALLACFTIPYLFGYHLETTTLQGSISVEQPPVPGSEDEEDEDPRVSVDSTNARQTAQSQSTPGVSNRSNSF
jgi:hypothetical protein